MSSLPGNTEPGPPFEFSTVADGIRFDLVSLSGDPNLFEAGGAFIPYTQFDLTALGANVSLDGFWDVDDPHGPQQIPLAEWKHVATNGRDQFVRIVLRGYLFPFGHRAVVVQIYERILYPDIAHPQRWSNAVIQEQTFIRVTQPVKTYPSPFQPYTTPYSAGGNQLIPGGDWPFTSIEMKTILTPSLGRPSWISDLSTPGTPLGTSASTPTVLNNQLVLVQDVNLNNVLWTYEVFDAAGRKSTVSGPLCFLFAGGVGENGENYADEYDYGALTKLAALYNDSSFTANFGNLSGETIQYAPEGSGKPGSTSHPTNQLTFLASTPSLDPITQGTTNTALPDAFDFAETLYQQSQPAFYPVLSQARVSLPAANGLSKSSFSDGKGSGVGIQYFPNFIKNAVNAGSVYMELSAYAASPHSTTLEFPGNQVGGVATPNVQLSGLSAVKGLVSGPLDKFASQGHLAPVDYFPAGLTGTQSPQLLGGLLLSNVLGQIVDPENLSSPAIPTIVNVLDPSTGTRTVTYTLTATTQPWGTDSTQPVFVPTDSNGNPIAAGTMNLVAVVTISPTGASSYTITGKASPFNINILGEGSGLYFIQIPINSMTFTAQSGKKTDIQVQVGQITFEGALNFVNTLEQFLEDLGGSGFKVNVTPSGINAGFSISLPDISVGMVDLSGLGMSAAVDVPFTGAPATATFSFASQQNPFTVTVSMFGGSGFITLVLGMNSVQQVTASIEFEGNFELNIYIASGGISLAAGIYFNYDVNNGLQLTGFVKLQGNIECLGIISVSCELDLSLTYQESADGSQSWVSGDALFTTSIHLVFFTIPIKIPMHKQFSGSGTAPAAKAAIAQAPQAPSKHPFATPAERVLSAGFSGGFTESVTPPDFADFIPTSNVWADYAGAYYAGSLAP